MELWLAHVQEKRRREFAEDLRQRAKKEEEDEYYSKEMLSQERHRRTIEENLSKNRLDELKQELDKLYLDYAILFKEIETMQRQIYVHRTNVKNAKEAFSSTVFANANQVVLNGVRVHEDKTPEQIKMFTDNLTAWVVGYAGKKADIILEANGSEKASFLTSFNRDKDIHKNLAALNKAKAHDFIMIVEKHNLTFITDTANEAEILAYATQYIEATGAQKHVDIIHAELYKERKVLKEATQAITKLDQIGKNIHKTEYEFKQEEVRVFSTGIQFERREERSKKIDHAYDKKETETIAKETETVTKETETAAKKSELVKSGDEKTRIMDGFPEPDFDMDSSLMLDDAFLEEASSKDKPDPESSPDEKSPSNSSKSFKPN